MKAGCPAVELAYSRDHRLGLASWRLRTFAPDDRGVGPALKGELRCLGIVAGSYPHVMAHALQASCNWCEEQRMGRIGEVDPDPHAHPVATAASCSAETSTSA